MHLWIAADGPLEVTMQHFMRLAMLAFLLCATHLFANPIALRITNGSTTVNQTGNGTVSYHNSIGGFTINIVDGTTQPVLALPNLLNLFSMQVKTNNNCLKHCQLSISLSATNFAFNSSSFQSSLAGSLGKTGLTAFPHLTFNTYLSATNAFFAKTTLLSSCSVSNSATVSCFQNTFLTPPAIYSLTEVLVLDVPLGGSANLNGLISAVPEPASMALLGAGILMIAVLFRYERGLRH